MRPSAAGRLHVIAGPMFAGKTEELLRRVHRARLAGLRVEVFGHRLDDRGGADRLSTHIGRTEPARMLERPQDLLDALAGDRPDLVALDEAQFFGPGLVPVLDELLRAGIQIEVAGLCITYDGGPFEPVPTLMAQAEEVVKLTAVCIVCGADAAFHVRLREPRPTTGTSSESGTPPDVDTGAPQEAVQEADALRATASQIGGAESYQARCRAHRQLR